MFSKLSVLRSWYVWHWCHRCNQCNWTCLWRCCKWMYWGSQLYGKNWYQNENFNFELSSKSVKVAKILSGPMSAVVMLAMSAVVSFNLKYSMWCCGIDYNYQIFFDDLEPKFYYSQKLFTYLKKLNLVKPFFTKYPYWVSLYIWLLIRLFI